MHQVTPGALDARVLDQETYWVTKEAAVLALRAMSTAHLTNVLALLHDHATRMHFNAMLDALAGLVEARATGATTAEEITDRLTGTSIATVSAEQYLDASPLVRAIRREVAARR